jgi:RNA polymerase sigma-70 factor (ECF subfamily)
MSAFVSDTEPYRRELVAHCYRMLGSAHDAEDVVQETYLRAWRGYQEFESRSSVRTWLYRIATNACLTALAHSSRRVLPSGLGGPADDPHAEPAPATNVTWLQVIPDSWVDDPAVVVTSRESLRLALVASLQHLPAQQRAVLLLRDVLAFPAADVAAMLNISVAAVKSALQRARARMQDVAPSADDVVEPTEPRARELLEMYMARSRQQTPRCWRTCCVTMPRWRWSGRGPGSPGGRPACHTWPKWLACRVIGGWWRSVPMASPQPRPTAAITTACCVPSGSRCST